ncbi:glycosyltransferase family 4 protein [Thalassorhabdus alkalitolerans]|uniref:Glycosyltransferase family 4 protein n=1 Tax=Thalassorhabdus alkalitolerans TaxID=2282697 RepID=A0ABW0YGA4_9BACI
MEPLYEYFIALFIAFIVTIATTPLVKKLALKGGFVDQPSQRKVHEDSMPRIGGLAIAFGAVAGLIYLQPPFEFFWPITIGALTILILGLIDDKYTLSPSKKLFGQMAAATIVVAGGLQIEFISLPFNGYIEFGLWSYPFTILWILAMVNAINLIDGLDGLAAGTSSIALTILFMMAFTDGQILAAALAIVLVGSGLGFLVFNFHPAKIFMGDTGSMFLGYSISIISMVGLFKNLTLFTLIIPIIILAVPIFDTFFAIIRRLLNKQKISTPDKGHLHYRLLALGFSHRTTVLILYGVSIFFGGAALVFSETALWMSILIILFLGLLTQVMAEWIGILGERKKPIFSLVKKLKKKTLLRQ